MSAIAPPELNWRAALSRKLSCSISLAAGRVAWEGAIKTESSLSNSPAREDLSVTSSG